MRNIDNLDVSVLSSAMLWFLLYYCFVLVILCYIGETLCYSEGTSHRRTVEKPIYVCMCIYITEENLPA